LVPALVLRLFLILEAGIVQSIDLLVV